MPAHVGARAGGRRERLAPGPVAWLLDVAAQRLERPAEIATGLIGDNRCRAPGRSGFRTVHEPVTAISRSDAASIKPVRTACVRVAPELGFIQRQSRSRQKQDSEDQAVHDDQRPADNISSARFPSNEPAQGWFRKAVLRSKLNRTDVNYPKRTGD